MVFNVNKESKEVLVYIDGQPNEKTIKFLGLWGSYRVNIFRSISFGLFIKLN